MVVFGNKWLYLGRIDCICAKWYYSKSSNKPPEGLLNFGPYGGGSYYRGELIKEGEGAYLKFFDRQRQNYTISMKFGMLRSFNSNL